MCAVLSKFNISKIQICFTQNPCFDRMKREREAREVKLRGPAYRHEGLETLG